MNLSQAFQIDLGIVTYKKVLLPWLSDPKWIKVHHYCRSCANSDYSNTFSSFMGLATSSIT